jgi:1,2-phenylacetyl-CoA epoxidase PaaB subunit
MSGRRGHDATLTRFEVYVRAGEGAEAFSMRVSDVYAADGADALRQARETYGHLAVVRGIDATRA